MDRASSFPAPPETPAPASPPAPASAAATLLIRAVRWYQRTLSPRKPAPTCRFTPTCSAYAVTALQRHGALKGGWLAVWRIWRCSPLYPGGYDPVPAEWPRRPRDSGEHNPKHFR